MTEKDLFDELEAQFEDVDVSDITPVTEMTTAELIILYNQMTTEVFDDRQALFPRTQDARDKHSLRYAAQIELKKRGYL